MEFQYTITEHIATISDHNGTTKELNRISYNGAPPKLDLRIWRQDGDTRKMLKGLTLTENEAEELSIALSRLYSRESMRK